MHKYELIIYWSAEDAVYVAEVSGRHALGKDRRGMAGLAGGTAGSISSSVALLPMPPGNLRLSQSQQLSVQGLEVGCLGAAAGD